MIREWFKIKEDQLEFFNPTEHLPFISIEITRDSDDISQGYWTIIIRE